MVSQPRLRRGDGKWQNTPLFRDRFRGWATPEISSTREEKQRPTLAIKVEYPAGRRCVLGISEGSLSDRGKEALMAAPLRARDTTQGVGGCF